MEHMIRMLTKQAQLLEIELANYTISKKNKDFIIQPETHYAHLAHAYKGIKYAIKALEESKKEQIHVH